MRRTLSALAALVGLSACVPMPDVGVRHVASTEPYGADARFHLFVFDPAEARSLSDRIRLARGAVRDDPDCRWVDAPTDLLRERTASQGTAYADTLLVAPLRCA